MQHFTDSTVRTHLARIADRVVELGTSVEAHRLTELARAIRSVAPGAAAALTDWEGSEISRLRAFAVASSAAVGLPNAEQALLVGRFEQPSTIPAAA